MSEATALSETVGKIHPADPRRFQDETILPLFAELRATHPVHYCEDSPYGPYWSLLKYKDIQDVDKDYQRFSSDAIYGGITIDDDNVGDPNSDFFVSSFITTDAPNHMPQRQAVTEIVHPRSLMRFESQIRQRAIKTLDDLPVGETFDWVERVSIELTTQMLAALFDFPFEDRYKLTRWSDVSTAEADSPIVDSQEARIAELMECLQYFKDLRETRKEGPAGFDLLTMLARDAATKDHPDNLFLGNLMLLIVGGNDTTRNTMSASVNAFNKFPDQFALLKENPNLLIPAVSEIIRWQTPLAHMRRTALEDVRIGEQTIRKGDKVIMWYYSGNRDTDVFANPDVIDIQRKNVRRHLSFGFGVHRCLGMRLAELQLKILWEEILQRWSHVEMVGEPRRVLSNFVNGYAEMPVRLHPK